MKILVFLVLLSSFSCISLKVDKLNAGNNGYSDSGNYEESDQTPFDDKKIEIENNVEKDEISKIKNNVVDIKNIKTPFFNGTYIIKPLWAFSEGKGNEEGEDELYFKIIVDGVEKQTGFQQDKKLAQFNGNNFEFKLKKDSIITIELWDADAFADDLLVKRVGVIPADLDKNGILYLKDEYSKLEVLFFKKPASSDNYTIFNKSIKVKEDRERIIDINFPIVFNHKFYKEANYAIDTKIPMTLSYSFKNTSKNNIAVVSNKYEIIYQNKNFFSIIFSDIVDSTKCYETECPISIEALTFYIKKAKILTSKDLFYENAYNSNSLCKIINRKLKKAGNEETPFLDCDKDSNKVINFNNFALKKDGVVFIIPYDTTGMGGYETDKRKLYLSFDELKGLVNIKNDWY